MEEILLSGLLGGLVGYAVGQRPPTDKEIIEIIRERKPAFAVSITIDTTTARDNQEYPFVGNLIKVENPEGVSNSVYLTLNESEFYQFDLTKIGKIKAPFYRFFITNTAGTGILRLLIGRGYGFDIEDVVSQNSTLPTRIRWGIDSEPSWIHAAEQTAPGAGTALVTKTVTAGKTGYIYGFFISAQEANDFLLNWTSGGAAKSKRIVFGGAGSSECIDPTPLNEGLGADAATDITITNVNAAGGGKIYQANLLHAEL